MASLSRLFVAIERAVDGGDRVPCVRSDSRWWFSDDWRDIDRAKELCAGCPARQECLDGATERGETGVWGGYLLEKGQVSTRAALRRRSGDS